MKIKMILSLFLIFATIVVQAQSFGTAFTYQGHMNIAGVPANGSYDFAFTLYTNSTTIGNEIGPVVTNGLPVTNGLFAASIDFGNVFTNGTAYWLEVSVSTNGTSFTPLIPLQPLTPTPYAIFANTSGNLTGNAPTATTANNFSGSLSGDVTGTQSATMVVSSQGNAIVTNNETGVTLSGQITASTATNFSGTLSGDVTGTQNNTIVSYVSGLSASSVANAINNATSAQTDNTIVKRDGSGNFSAQSITVIGYKLFVNGSTPLYSDNEYNAAFGENAFNSVSGSAQQNTAIGSYALQNNSGAYGNTAIGYGALGSTSGSSFSSGSYNIGIGANGGHNIASGNNNIEISNQGASGDNNVIKIGTEGTQSTTYIAGISGVTISPSGAAVYVNSSGQLGTVNSSRRFKEDIQNMGDQSDVLLSLRPVSFHYKPDLDPQGTPQFGLIAEEVEKVAPELVLRDNHGDVYSVRYEQINAMLLNEFLKEHDTVESQSAEIEKLQQTVAQLKDIVDKLATNQKQADGK